MKIKISSRDLRIGMYVCELDRPWRETPFLFQGFEVRSDEDLRTLQRYCREVYVLQGATADAVPGIGAWREWRNVASPAAKQAEALQFEQELLKLNNHPTARSVYEDKTTLEEEIELVRGAYTQAQHLVQEILNYVRLGRSLDGTAVRHSVSALAESVLRNPDALTCYALLKRKHDYLASRSLRTAILMLVFGRQLGMSRDRLETLGMAGLLHDLGMVKVPDEILAKPERLTPIETAIVRRHVTWGAEMLERSHGMPPSVIAAARDHHERVDGSGYLRGSKGDAIGEAGLLIGIVDFYDAVTSARTYQESISPYAAMHVMYEARGRLFQSELVERFIQCLGVYPVGSIVELNTGEVGVVVALNRTARLKPRVALVCQPDKTPYPLPPVVNLATRRTLDGATCEVDHILDPQRAGLDPLRYLPVASAA